MSQCLRFVCIQAGFLHILRTQVQFCWFVVQPHPLLTSVDFRRRARSGLYITVLNLCLVGAQGKAFSTRIGAYLRRTRQYALFRRLSGQTLDLVYDEGLSRADGYPMSDPSFCLTGLSCRVSRGLIIRRVPLRLSRGMS